MGAGYGAGTPLTWNDSVALETVAASAKQPFEDVIAAVTKARLAPISRDDQIQSACSRERPVVIDVGGGMGLISTMAGKKMSY